MTIVRGRSSKEARNQLGELLDAAEAGQSTIITRYGRPAAVLVPFKSLGAAARQQSLMPVAGTGRGLWGRHSARTLRQLRDEWNR